MGSKSAQRQEGELSFYAELQSRCFYEIFIRSFRDSNHDGIGDINGIRESLDYLADLGVGGIWLTPFFPAPSYHNYDPVDLLDVDSSYGTMLDFRLLVEEAHKRDMLVLMDFVANHTSWKHAWFERAIKGEEPYRSYYLWQADAPQPKEGQWHRLPGPTTHREKYYACFSRTMPDLNFDHPHVRRQIIRAACWWLQRTDVDGFRLDAAQHIYPSDNTAANVKWWAEFAAAVRVVKPRVLLIGECWNKVTHQAAYLEALDGVFNFELAEGIQQAVLEENAMDLPQRIAQMLQTYGSFRSPFVHCIFLSNHDMTRIYSVLKHSIEKMRMAACLLLTLPGLPFIYYGEEIGMRGLKPDPYLREPFLWSKNVQQAGQTHWLRARYTTRRVVEPAQEQRQRPNSLLNYYRKLIGLRRCSPALSRGDFIPLQTAHPALMAYERRCCQQVLLIVHNLSSKSQRISADWLTADASVVFRSQSGAMHQGTYLSLPSYSSVILQKPVW
ncbi:MAG: alpha-amylase family glycosyl hydrolase [Chitinophagales bacterium]|nr:alpha-amylase family glycosyl hydrolase [Chitinophagales bacterium]MDW8427482.1 alpha-amylase family glycosyl hydrolase [Chitinophagales bacterium]